METLVVRPTADLGGIAAHVRREAQARMGALTRLITFSAARGTPHDEADLLSYLFFDQAFTRPLLELGREDARRREEEIARVLLD